MPVLFKVLIFAVSFLLAWFAIYKLSKWQYKMTVRRAAKGPILKVLDGKGYQFISIEILSMPINFRPNRGDFEYTMRPFYDDLRIHQEVYCYLYYLDANNERKRCTVKIPVGTFSWFRKIKYLPEL